MLMDVTLGLLCVAATFLSFGKCDVLTNFTDCDELIQLRLCSERSSSTGKIVEVRIIPCPTSRCVLKKKTDIGLEIDFQTNENTDDLIINMYGILMKSMPPLPWNGIAKKACDNTTDANGTPACPVKDGNQVLHYRNSFPVLKMYPSMQLGVRVAITDASDKTLICFTFDVKIED